MSGETAFGRGCSHQSLHNQILKADENTLTYLSESLAPGIYFLTVQVGTAKKTLRLLKQ